MNPVLSFFLDLLHNYAFMSAGGAWLVAQASKVIYETVRYGFDTKRLAGGGGMPSTHSATVTGLTVGCLLQNSAASSEFAIALILARDGSQDPEPPEKEGYPRRSQASFQQAAGGEDGTYPAGGSGRHRDRDRDGDRDVPRVSPDSVKVGRLNRPFARMQLRR